MKRMLLVTAIVALAAGWMLGRGCQHPQPAAPAAPAAATVQQAQIWTCSMHPQIRQPKPGLCPLCGMDLIPAGGPEAGAADDGPRTLTLSATAQALAEVETAPVERRWVDVEVPMVGKVGFDETRLAYITARFPGRIDRLYANVTGTPVKPGEHLADLYSPELISAQQELRQAIRAAPETGAGRDASQAFIQAARDKLRLWGLTPEQIADIERSDKTQDHLTFYAPIGGVVVEKEALEGLYVEPGMRLFTVADLSAVWVNLQAYESDLAWVRYGQPVEFAAEAYPGETFRGTVVFINPVLDPMTRTVGVRVNAENPAGRLKPGMFVHARIKARVAADGIALPTDLSGRWICPMHPEVLESAAGTCRICQMPLVPAADTAYGARAAAASVPLVIPASAPLVTGTRAVVYVALPGAAGRFEGREISLGPRAGDFYVVRGGLAEGELVVTRGAFKIDSALQIEGRPSMMQPAEPPPAAVEPGPEQGGAGVPQALCPVMGGAINKDYYADYNGLRVYFCCPACKEPFLKDAETFLKKMRAAGVEPEVLK